MPEGASSLELRGTGTYNGSSGAGFRVCIRDNGEGSAAPPDLFHLSCTVDCTYDTDTRTPDDAIDGGNIQVRPADGGTSSSSPGGSGAEQRAATTILDPLLLTQGVVGQVQTFAIRVYDHDQEPLPGASVVLSRASEGGGSLVLSAVTDSAGVASVLVTNVANVAEYTATSGGVQSNAVELTPLLG